MNPFKFREFVWFVRQRRVLRSFGRSFLSFIVAIGFCNLFANAADREPWADERLPKVDGLEMWYDASRSDGRKMDVEPRAKLPLSVWHDASGNRRDVVQVEVKSRPKLVTTSHTSVVRFDGEDDHFTAAGFAHEFTAMTVFIVTTPFDNPGAFRGFLATNRDGKNDYVSGVTIDMGGLPSPRFETLNPEGIGFGGARDEMTDSFEFGTTHTIAVSIDANKATTYIDGKSNGTRPKSAGSVAMDRLTVGARYYNNSDPKQFVQGFLEGDIAEILVFGRALPDNERASIERYLNDKYATLFKAKTERPAKSHGGKRLIHVPGESVQMFVPGFRVSELPVDLTNINYVRYRHDGVLVAGGYDGRVWFLRDTDGDGLEDSASLYFSSPNIKAVMGMAVAPKGYPRGDGVFVGTVGRVVFIPDRDGDGRGDEEVVVAKDWTPARVTTAGVSDCLGVTLDREGNVWFGLGTSDFTNAYMVGKDGESGYQVEGERGTIQKVSADWKTRSTICSGVRFSVGLAFNSAGDLFCTDQEGATWLANGNPFDELLHIQKDRHYGFPPRHPKHLPKVIDEPSVFDFGPQHQSTCGLAFNGPIDDTVFGPAWWRGDAFICGESRGKLWRVKLVNTEAGYVAQSQLIAGLAMMPIDCERAPNGGLIITCHSGGPDWGSGPAGKGKLFKVRLAESEKSRPAIPMFAYSSNPNEVRIAFDRPISAEKLAEQLKDGNATIDFGDPVAAGDRFEAFRPGYEVVKRQTDHPRFELPVHSIQVSPDRSSLILSTARHAAAVGYSITIGKKGEEIDLGYDMNGVEAIWLDAKGNVQWQGWLPHVDTKVSRELTKGSSEHDRLWKLVGQPGVLSLRTQLRLKNMLRPVVQPGSKIDYTWPDEQVTLFATGSNSIKVRAGANDYSSQSSGEKSQLSWKTSADDLIPVQLQLTTGGMTDFSLTWSTQEDERRRAFPLRRFLLPWAKIVDEVVPPGPRVLPQELAGGSWSRGWKVFFDPSVGCARCHTIQGFGAKVGPDLSNVRQRDYESVLRDIEQPSFSINPEFISHQIELVTGQVVSGIVRRSGEKLRVGDYRGEFIDIDPKDVEEMRPATVSIMPAGQPKVLGEQRMKDLLTFLLTDPPHMPEYGPLTPPPARSMSEVNAILANPEMATDVGRREMPRSPKPLNVVLVSGPKDHGPGEHDYPAWQVAWRELMGIAPNTHIDVATGWPSEAQFRDAQVLVFFQQGSWTDEKGKQIDEYLQRGGGLVYLHYAVDGGAKPNEFAERIGLAWQGGRSKFRHGELDLQFARGSKHPIARNFDRVHFHDESYWQLVGSPKKVQVLATGIEDGVPQPLFWTTEPGKGRVFVSILGHFSWTFDDPAFRTLVLRAIAWSAGESVDRFNELVTIGARVKGE